MIAAYVRLYYHLCHNLTTCAISIDLTVFMCYTCTRNTKGGMRMIAAAASLIVEVLIRHGIIKVQQAEVYQYGLEILISSLLTCCITVVCGLLFRCLAAALLYFLMFAVLRSICGGYHADTYWKCNLVFTLVTAVVLFFFRWMPVKQFTELHYCSIAIAILTTAFCTPVENENKPPVFDTAEAMSSVSAETSSTALYILSSNR